MSEVPAVPEGAEQPEVAPPEVSQPEATPADPRLMINVLLRPRAARQQLRERPDLLAAEQQITTEPAASQAGQAAEPGSTPSPDLPTLTTDDPTLASPDAGPAPTPDRDRGREDARARAEASRTARQNQRERALAQGEHPTPPRLDLRDLNRTIRQAERWLDKNPGDVNARLLYADALRIVGRYSEAYQAASEALQRDQTNPATEALMAVLQATGGKHREALMLFRQALAHQRGQQTFANLFMELPPQQVATEITILQNKQRSPEENERLRLLLLTNEFRYFHAANPEPPEDSFHNWLPAGSNVDPYPRGATYSGAPPPQQPRWEQRPGPGPTVDHRPYMRPPETPLTRMPAPDASEAALIQQVMQQGGQDQRGGPPSTPNAAETTVEIRPQVGGPAQPPTTKEGGPPNNNVGS